MSENGYPECMGCGKLLAPGTKKQNHGKGSVPSVLDCCWDCFTTMSVHQRLMVVIAARDRAAGGVLSEMAAALDRLDQSRHEDEPGEDWKLGDSESP